MKVLYRRLGGMVHHREDILGFQEIEHPSIEQPRASNQDIAAMKQPALRRTDQGFDSDNSDCPFSWGDLLVSTTRWSANTLLIAWVVARAVNVAPVTG